MRHSALLAPLAFVALFITFGGTAVAGICLQRAQVFAALAARDQAIVAKAKAAGAQGNCAVVVSASRERLAILRRMAGMRPSVMNCEDAEHVNSDRDPPGIDERQILATQQAIAECQSAMQARKREPGLNVTPGIKPRVVFQFHRLLAEARSIIQEVLPPLVDRELTYYDRWITAHNKVKRTQSRIEQLSFSLERQMEAGRQREAVRTNDELARAVALYKSQLRARDLITR